MGTLMKLHFEPDLEYQLDAIEAVCDLFRGQEVCHTEFALTRDTKNQQPYLSFAESYLGIGNQLALPDDEVTKNLKNIQLRNALPPSNTDSLSFDFTVEMETGTGKTYVYLRSIFEMNKRYGFTKFVIVVPSIAIKEGVYKSLQITEDHFKGLYSGIPFECFLYDSSKLGQVRNFATSFNIQIMVVTVGAINKKDVNNLYKDSEKTGGEKPIDLIKATRPVIIVDEPQSVDGGLTGRGKEALDAMDPLCTLRYSATHADKHHMVYRLDAVDAYEKRLVKQIEVAAATIENAHNRPYVKLLSVSNNRGQISAKVELDIQHKNGVMRKQVSVQDGDELEQITGRAVYANYRIGEIRVEKGNEYMELREPGKECCLVEGQAVNEVNVTVIQREMIRRTIREHFEKEKILLPQGIKVLTLFFVDEVAKYRQYDKNGNPVKGEYARIFEEEYIRAAKLPSYSTLFGKANTTHVVEKVHDGYFSIDRKGNWTNTNESNKTNRDNAERAYNLIMREKEKLLSLESPLKFIFSHSALREGWDNPNVFQICSLRNINTERERRQTIGRGLRLCVNQKGQRIRGFDVNTLTVIASESYQDFAENLQKEIESDTGIRFGVVERHSFAAIAFTDSRGDTTKLGFDQSEILWEHLKDQGLIDSEGNVQDSLRQSLKNGSLMLPGSFNPHLEQITDILKKVVGRREIEIKNADDRQLIRPRQAVLDSPEFKELWNRIKHKTTYRVKFDSAILVRDCVKKLNKAPSIPKTRLQWRKADMSIEKGGVEPSEKQNGAATTVINESDIELPDILTELQDRTQLTRRTICQILINSSRLGDFKSNPQQFIRLTEDIINHCKQTFIVDGIKYHRLGKEQYYAQELFEKQELKGYLKNLVDSRKSVYEKIVYESKTESDFAAQLEKNSAVRVYAKLPGWFTVPTPLGSYNPDWAVLVEQENEERLYFVVETKGTMFDDELRLTEKAKIDCGKEHFKALESNAMFSVAKDFDTFVDQWS